MKTGKTAFSTGFLSQFEKAKARTANNPALRPSLLAAFSLFLGIFTGTYIIPINATYANANIDVPATASDDHEIVAEKDPIEKKETKAITSPKTSTSGRTASGAYGSNYVSNANLSIPALGISTPVSPSALNGNELSVPSSSVSVYGTLLMGHSSGVFSRLSAASVGQEVVYNGKTYVVDSVRLHQRVSADRKKAGNFSMYVLTNLGANRIVMMTCAGAYENGNWTERTLVFATQK